MKRLLSLILSLGLAGLAAPLPALADEAASPSPDAMLKLRWQRLLREADDKIADAQHKVDSARQAAEVASRQAVLVGSGQNMAARVAAMDAQKKAEADLAAAQKAKVDLLEQGRVEGVPPGYLR